MNTLSRNPRHATLLRRNRGAALLLVVGFMLVSAMLISAYWAHLNSVLRAARVMAKEQRTHELAQAGIAHAVALLRTGQSLAGVGPITLGEGFYTVRVTAAADGAQIIEVDAAMGIPGETFYPQHLRAAFTGPQAPLRYLTEGE